MPRFVILQHDWPELHFDLMIEDGAVLKSWRLSKMPQADLRLCAVALPDHRLHYLDYEGPVSGYRGRVVRRDAGFYQTVTRGPDGWEVKLTGQQFRGAANWRPDRNEWYFGTE